MTATARAPEQTRARYPDDDGYVERAGVRVFWERYGDGDRTILLLPTWSIVHSRVWKAQIAYLARHFRVVTFDGRGNGRSDRQEGATAYSTAEFAADAVAVMDAAGVDHAAVACQSCGALWGTILAAGHAERVDGVVYIGPAVALAPGHPERNVWPFEDAIDTHEGWATYNRHHWREHYEDFLRFFFAKCFNEPHSTKQIEDAVGWALETTPDTLVDTERGIGIQRQETFPETCARVRCRTLVIHGDRDLIRPHSQGTALARTTRGQLVTMRGSGHIPSARDPVRVNLLLREFIEQLAITADSR